MATIRDVATAAGVSISTVSLALNESGPVSALTRKKVWDAVKATGYAPNRIAQSLARGHTQLIGMVLGDVSNPFLGGILKEVEQLALSTGHLVIVSDSDASGRRELEILDHLSALRVQGVLMTPHSKSAEFIKFVNDQTMPIVMIDHFVEGIESDFVASDNVLASAMITEHVIRLGHRRIAHIAGIEGLWTSEQREIGFRDTMSAADIEVDESLVVYGDYRGERAYEQTMRLLTGPNPPTAILAANNEMALGALQALNQLGIPCPDEISLASIDDVPWGEVIRPRITMVAQPMELIARAATEFLMDRIAAKNGPKIPPRKKIFIPRLFIGESCKRIDRS